MLGGTTVSTYDRADRITAAGSTAITVNANGNTVARGTDTFTYDQANRMTTATVGGSTETSTYDGGVRFSRQVGTGHVTRYVTDVATLLPVTIDDGSRTYVCWWDADLVPNVLERFVPNYCGWSNAVRAPSFKSLLASSGSAITGGLLNPPSVAAASRTLKPQGTGSSWR